MKVSAIRKGLFFAIVAAGLGLGCELIVDFDRTRIPVEGTDGATPTPEGGPDAPVDSPVDAPEADAPAACNTVALTGTPVVVQTATAAPPDPTGGTIVAGNYVLTSQTEYNATDAGATTSTVRITLMGTTNTISSITELGADGGIISTLAENFTYVATGAGDAGVLTLTKTCPGTGATPYPYSVTNDGGTVELRQPDGKTVRVFTKQ